MANRRNPGARWAVGVGGGQLQAPEPARGALGQQGEKEGGKWLPSRLEPGLGGWRWPGTPSPRPQALPEAVRSGGALTGSGRPR